ncbi:hypothetical protein C8Q72DRAFT_879537 [Fomitopsis betulina]|nr:hypothetical protein C8Q72DRAFT_879537 [Fomitopsis betulina]
MPKNRDEEKEGCLFLPPPPPPPPPPAPALKMAREKSREDRKKEKKRQKEAAAAAALLKAPPHKVPPLRTDAPAEAPQSSTSAAAQSDGDRPTSSDIQVSNNSLPSTSTHTATGSQAEPPRQLASAQKPGTRTHKYLRKREKKLAKVVELMEHDIHSSRVSRDITNYRMAARLVSRVTSPFANAHDALVYGLEHADNSDSVDSDSDDDDDDDIDADLDEPAQKARKKARLITSLTLLEEWCMPLYGYGDALDVLPKHGRGWNNQFTARLICPQRLLEDFDAGESDFRTKVGSGDIVIAPGDYTSLLYDQKLADSAIGDEATLVGLLRSLLLVACYKRLFTGRSSALFAGACTRAIAGKQPISREYKLKQVQPRCIAYVVVLAHFCLSSQEQFNMLDDVGEFSNFELFYRIVNLLHDAESPWVQETMAWWNKRVYGTVPASTIPRADRPETAADRLEQKQKAERKARRAAQRARASAHAPPA